MFNLFIVATLLMGASTYGRASQYAESVMDKVIENRLAWGQIPKDLDKYDGFVAVRECADIGKEYYLRPEGGKTWELFLAVDCASKSDRQSDIDSRSGWEWMRDTETIVEVDYETAVRWNTVGRMIVVRGIGFYE